MIVWQVWEGIQGSLRKDEAWKPGKSRVARADGKQSGVAVRAACDRHAEELILSWNKAEPLEVPE